VNNQYSVDANIFITAWNVHYPPHVFISLWEQIAQFQQNIFLIKPIFDEIDPISSADKKLSKEKKHEKYPLKMWMADNGFVATPVSDSVNDASLNLEMEYETNNNPKGANQNDITLVAYAKLENKKVMALLDAPFNSVSGFKVCSFGPCRGR
jgi:hypothetical protein